MKRNTLTKTSAISTTALTLVGLAVSPTTAQAAEPEPQIKVDAVKTFDGTGYDSKSTQCVIRAENNFPGLTDENANDNNVCHNDTVGVKLDFNVPAKDQEQTFLVTLTPKGGLKIDQSTFDTWKAWCENNDSTRTGVDRSNPSVSGYNGDLSCRITVPANTSSLGSVQVAFLADNKGGKTGSIDLTVEQNGQNSTQRIADVNILSTFQKDVGIRANGVSTSTTINGVAGRVFPFRVVYEDGRRWSSFASVKGLKNETFDGFSGTIRLDPSKLTSGARVVTNDQFTNVNGIPTYTGKVGYAPGDTNYTLSDANRKGLTFEVFVPSTAKEATMPIGLGDIDLQVDDPKFSHPLNYGVGSQPGNNVGSPSVSQTTNPAIFQSNMLGPNALSNSADWAVFKLTDTLAFKQLVMDSDGTPGKILMGPGSDGSWSSRYDGIRPGDKYWTGADIPAEPREGDISFCDTWQTAPARASDRYAPQFYDQSRKPVVQAFRDGEWVDIPFTQQYRKTDAGMDCARPNDDAGWSNTGTSTVDDSANSFNATRVRIKADDHKNERVRVYFPFTTPSAGAIDGYPNSYVVNDRITYTSAMSTEATYPEPRGLSYNLSAVGLNNGVSITTSSAAFAGQIIPSNVNYSTSTYFSKFRPGDDTKVEHTMVIDYDPCVTPTFDQGQINALRDSGSKVVIREADLGADGVGCTADDGLPTQVTITKENFDVTDRGYTSNNFEASLFVSPFLKAGQSINPVKVTQSFKDPDGLIYFRPPVATDVKTTSIQGGATVAQSNVQTTKREWIGDRVGWVSKIFNATDNDYGRSTFINILPNADDKRWTESEGQFNDVRITASDNIRQYVKVTTADTKNISRDARTAADDPNIKWCSLDDTECLGGKEITAYIVDLPEFKSKTIGTITVDADTDNMTEGSLMNDLGNATVDGFDQPIQNTNDVETYLRGLGFQVVSTADYEGDGRNDGLLGNTPFVIVSPSGKEYRSDTGNGYVAVSTSPEFGTWTIRPAEEYAGLTLVKDNPDNPFTIEVTKDLDPYQELQFELYYKGTSKPVATTTPDNLVTESGQSIYFNPLTNDNSPTGWMYDGNFYYVDPDNGPTNTLKVEGGTYSVEREYDEESGDLINVRGVFTPDPGFTGQAPPVTYAATDGTRSQVEGQIITTVLPVAGPKTTDDSSETEYNTPVTIDALGNDAASSEQDPLDLETFALLDADGNQVKELTTTEGVWSIVDGKVKFTPVDGYTGTTAPVRYRVADKVGGQSSESVITVTVKPRPNVVPTANDDSGETKQGREVTLAVLDNDKSGADYDLIQAGSVKLRDADGNTFDTLTTDEGVYRVVEDNVVFTPNADFVGTTKPVTYEVTDSNGDKATATVVVTVTEVPRPVYKPTAVDDFAKTKPSTPVQIDLIVNDKAGDESDPIEDESIAFLDADGNRVERLTTSEGVYEIVEDSVIQFTPAEGFTGRTKPVPYQVSDSTGDVATANIVIEVEAPKPANVVPTANDDQGRTKQGVPLTLDVHSNDVSGSDKDLIDPTKSRFVNENGNLVKRLELAEGVFEFASDGKVKFTPAKDFTGVVPPVRYRVVDSNGDTSTAFVRVVVDPVASKPSAKTDFKVGKLNKPTTVDVLANDTPTKGSTFRKDTLRLIDKNGDRTTRLVIEGEGVWTVKDGKLVFTPVKDYLGLSKAPYTVVDSTGARVNSVATVGIEGTVWEVPPGTKVVSKPEGVVVKPLPSGRTPRKPNVTVPKKVESKVERRETPPVASDPNKRQVVIHTGVAKGGEPNGGRPMYPVIAGGIGGLGLLGLFLAARSRRNRSADARNN